MISLHHAGLVAGAEASSLPGENVVGVLRKKIKAAFRIH
jgi:hypothetical protein